MNHVRLSRRSLLARLGAAGALALVPPPLRALAGPHSDRLAGQEQPFRFGLNTSTLRGHNLGIVRELEIAAEAGYDSVEVWIDAIQRYVEGGGSLADLRQRIEDLGLRVENAIGFARWIVDDDETRAQALEQLRSEMDLLAQIGCTRIAAPPAGATDLPLLDLRIVAERFRTVLDLGLTRGVVPQLELWGFSRNLGRLSELLYVAAECGHPAVRLLPDVYHLYKGGSDLFALRLVAGSAIEIIHLNDYPAGIARADIQDSDRVLPGDGVAPLADLIRTLRDAGGRPMLSLEIFNRTYWEQDPLQVARMGLEKMRAVVEAALS